MAKKRAKVSDQAEELASNQDLFAKTDTKQQATKRPDRVLSRASYDMTPEIKTAVAKRATMLGLPASQFAMFLLSDALRRFDAGEIDPRPFLINSPSPKFRHNLEMSNQWFFEDSKE